MLQMIRTQMEKLRMDSKGQAQNVIALVVTAIVVIIALLIWNVVTAGLGAAGQNTAAGTGYGNLGSLAGFAILNVATNTLLPVYAIVVAAVVIIGILGFLQRSQ